MPKKYSDPQAARVGAPSNGMNHSTVGRVTPVNAWWDDSKPNKRLYGSKGQILIDIPARQIGFKKR
jgi:hypothetical protein